MHSAKLIQMSKPLGDMENLSPEEMIVYMARVSSPENQANTESSSKLIKYLLVHGHFSPFEMVTLTIHVETTRAISRQLLRHRSLHFQEFSGRYAEMSPDMVEQQCRLQDPKNRQSSLDCTDEDIKTNFMVDQSLTWKIAIDSYKMAIEYGVAKEAARSLLPEGLTKSSLYVTGTVRDFIFYLKQRIGNGTQKEHETLAKSIAEEIRPHFPLTLKKMGI